MDALTQSTSRDRLTRLQNAMVPFACELPAPLHRFAPGLYMRELIVPAGMLIVGKIHRHEHFLIVLSGVAEIRSEFGNFRVEAGHVSNSPAGVKRAVYAVSDTRFITIHANAEDSQDLKLIEAQHIEPETLVIPGGKGKALS